MSQQEFFQGPQFQEQEQPTLEDDEIEYSPQPYYWSTQPGKGAPKDEPASLSDEPMVQADYPGDYQHGYVAQDNRSNTAGAKFIPPTREQSNRGKSEWRSQTQRQHFSPDGDSFEHQYRPYGVNKQQWSAPPWARPQRHHRGAAGWFWLIVLGLVFMGPLLHFIGALLAVAGIIILTLLVPFLFVAMLALPYIFFRAITGRPIPGRRWPYTNYWRGPWRW